ncbi:PREDICTED: olfactory receptor 10A3-like [Cyprinodon variegatus]|uniref:olfactory receptor 10A3-like n=1 Tax=Cyprinodon variegatus TaxID=28743 RepID=UPI000742A69B|nr:PREDICTED: olfactory receptor 10A3-like [Cyprinodon variegatus]
MMVNSTLAPYLILGAYLDIKQFKYLLFLIILCLYMFIVASNVLLSVVIAVNRSLHEPMYILLFVMFVNQLFGSTSLFPFLLVQILSDVHTISVPLCFLQVYCLHIYGSIEYFTLTIMSYDRYLAICYPLQYNSRMTNRKVAALIVLEWVSSCVIVSIYTSMSYSLDHCKNVLNRVYCNNYSLVQLTCSDTTINNIYGLISTVFSVCLPVILIIYTYMRILKVCYSGSKATRQKAVSTCTPHLASLLNFTLGVWVEILQSRLQWSHAPKIFEIFLSIYFLICQPLFNPLVYGLKLSKIRNLWKQLLSFK